MDDWFLCIVFGIIAALLCRGSVRAMKTGKARGRGRWISKEDDPEHFRFMVRADFITAAMLGAFVVYVVVKKLFPTLNLPGNF
jgi:hypothetical protein